MRNIIRYIIQHQFQMLFLFLEVISLSLVFTYNPYHKSVFISSCNRLTGAIYEKSGSISQYFSLQKVNEQLATENAFLRSRLPENIQLSENPIRLITDSLKQQQYVYRSCNVINNSVNKQYNFLTLDKGRSQGIKPETGVVCSDGVVGIVRNVSGNYATVISLLNTRLKISARLKGTNYFGAIEWGGKSYQHAMLTDIPLHAKIGPGDVVETSGFSDIFPAGIPIGVVEVVTAEEGESFFNIKVKLNVDYKRLTWVETVENTMRSERVNLEQQTYKDE